MPVHPLDACCGHLVSQAITNIQRLAGSGKMSEIKAEAEHIAPVVEMLDEYLLRKDHGRLKEAATAYWEVIRPRYVQTAETQSVKDFDVAWAFFASILNIPYAGG
jgi:hypothetical protein